MSRIRSADTKPEETVRKYLFSTDTLQRIFRIASANADDDTMRRSGVDVTALDASIDTIRGLFLAAVTGREQIEQNYNAKLVEVRAQKDAMEADLRAQIADLRAQKEFSEEKVKEAEKVALRASQELSAVREQAATAASLATEREKIIASQAAELATLREKATGYDDLKAERDRLSRELSDEKKDADLRQERAVREVELENARLKTKIEMLEAQHQPQQLEI